MNQRDEHWMGEAILAARNAPAHPFGSVIVDTAADRKLSVGWNRGGEHPLWHGEIDAINRWVATGGRDGTGLSLYTTAEPCCMCFGAIFWTKISRVVFGTSIDFLKRFGWDQVLVPASELNTRTTRPTIEIVGGVREAACDRLFQNAG